MRKVQKKQIEEFVKLLGQAHGEIKKAVERNDRALAMDLLQQCQEGAVELGNQIEEEEGEDFITIHLLADYCERVYQIYEKIRQDTLSYIEKEYKNLQKSLVRIENSVRNDIKIHLEAVFLPYKASMWDSMESVWRTADEDPDCRAYVIPIPYYDKNPDGSFGEMHYEGGMYPEDVPVTWYKEYDFEKQRPDMIFIHNPYDEYNYVTSVHPLFYSGNLKLFTEQLIYIPYFILDEISPDNKAAVDSVKHFCMASGVTNADKVFVQSEDMRQIYINALAERDGEESRNYWEKKIYGLGSPKVDKILSTRKEDVEIPDDWQKIIRKPDGTRKKIIFYNTSVTALLQNEWRMLEKMRDVFRVFYENKEEAALLWRPHPLMKATIESMRPELWAEYKRIMEQYRAEGWGIYDDSADLNRAAALSDAYYGDGSSVAYLFHKAHKFAMLQNMWLPKKKDWRKNVRVSNDAVIDGNDLWIVSNYANVLLHHDMSNGALKGVYYFPEKISDTYFSIAFVKMEDKIFFAPYNSEYLWSFDLRERQFEKIDLGLEENERSEKQKFGIILEHKQKIVLAGFGLHYILCIDPESGKTEKFDTYLEELKKRNIEKKDAFFGYQYEIVEDVLYLPMLHHNIIVTFGLEDHVCRVYDAGGLETQGFYTICHAENMFWLTNDRDEEISWSPDDGVKSVAKLGFLESHEKFYRHVYQYGDKFIYFAAYESKVMIKDKYGNVKRVSFSYPESEIFPEGMYSKFEFIKKDKDKLYFQARSNGDCYFIDLERETIEEVKLEVPDDVYGKIVKNLFESVGNQIVEEAELLSMANYLRSGKSLQGREKEQGKACGERIYRSIKGGV